MFARTRFATIVLAVALGPQLGAIAHADTGDMQARLDALERQNAAIQRENAMLREQIRLREQNAALRERYRAAPEPRGPQAQPTQTPPAQAGLQGPAVTGSFAAAPGNIATYKAPAFDSGGRFYLRGDGAYQSIGLPTFAAGIHRNNSGDFGPINRFDLPATGASGGGAVGYEFPTGTFPEFAGRVRTEIGGSYVRADGHQFDTATTSVPAGAGGYSLVLLNGYSGSLTFVCPTCMSSSNLQTKYESWQGNWKVATDYRVGPLTLSPSVSAIAGRTRLTQQFDQMFTGNLDYSLSSLMSWSDMGGKVGVDLNWMVQPWMTVGIGGSYGAAQRRLTGTASDASVRLNATSFVTIDESLTAHIANAEASIALVPTRDITVRGFFGLNRDDHVPGLTTSDLAGTPAGLTYAAQTSYYAGGGVTGRFSP
jgi:hypothetical protein